MQIQKGFTLIELLVTIVILGVLMAFAIPAYQNYVATSEEGVVRANILTMQVFQEDFFLRTGAYAHDLDDIGEIQAAIGWNPRVDDGITYAIDESLTPTVSYEVTATHPDGWTVCLEMPTKDNCP